MLSLEHTNVMSLRGVCAATYSPLLILPFMANGSVLEYIKHHKDILCVSMGSKVDVVARNSIYSGTPLWGGKDTSLLKSTFLAPNSILTPEKRTPL